LKFTTICRFFRIHVLALFFLAFSPFLSNAQQTAFEGNTILLEEFELYTGAETDIKKIAKSSEFQLLKGKVPNLGVRKESAFLKFKLKNESQDFFLNGFIDNSAIDEVELYQIDNSVKMIVSSGESRSFEDKGSEHPNVNWQFFIQPGSTQEFILRVKSGEQLLLPVKIGREKYINAEQATKELFYGIYLGCILVMLVYNLFVFFTVKDRVYLYYVAYILTVGLTQLVLNGYTNKYLWPNGVQISFLASVIIPVLSGVTTVLFSRKFIDTKQHTPKVDKVLLFFLGLYGVVIVLAFFDMYNLAFTIIDMAAASALLLVYCAAVAARRGNRTARFFLIAFVIFLVGVTLFALRNLGVIPFSNLSNYALPIGSALETVLLSFALADRINQFKKEKDESQQKMIAVMIENQKLVEEQNVQLELKVHERTLELESANGELNSALQELKLAQNQLVEAEKLASLGQMTAGIAHEINNPINFVSSNVQPLKRDVEDVIEVLNDYSSIETAADFDKKLPELKAKMKKLDIPYLRTEIAQLLGGIEEGARRTAEIVKGLRVFSRMDRDSLVSSSVNDCILSTLVVMKSITKGEVMIERELTTPMPEIMCFPGKLNQVFMNIVSNAIAATKHDGRPLEERKIWIRSAVSEKTITVEIEDNGIGIPEDIRVKIFDPFFTTKGVGEGTGLGLSIVKGIIDEHQGEIRVTSEVGKGSKFTINLPRFLA
jgi:signal transduction histidine kinase